MMNNIFQRQNEADILRCLVAQRNEYSHAKKLLFIKELATAGFAIFSVVASFLDIETLTAIVFLCSCLLLIAGKYIDIHSAQQKNHAAAIQQYIDVTLFSYVFNDKKSDWGTLPTDSERAELLSTVDESDMDTMRDWYSDYSNLSPCKQVFYCQKENLRWDNKLRNSFKKFIVLILIVIALLLGIAAITINPSFIKLICVVSWMLPLADFVLSIYRNLNSDIHRLNKLHEKSREIDNLLPKNDSGPAKAESSKQQAFLRKQLIILQTEIKKHREESMLIPNWFYNWNQKKYQQIEDKIASTLQNAPCESRCENET